MIIIASIGLVVAVIGLVVAAIGLYSHTRDKKIIDEEFVEIKEDITTINDKCKHTELEIEILKFELHSVEDNHRRLRCRYNELFNDYNELRKNYAQFKKSSTENLQELRKEHESLLEEHNTFKNSANKTFLDFEAKQNEHREEYRLLLSLVENNKKENENDLDSINNEISHINSVTDKICEELVYLEDADNRLAETEKKNQKELEEWILLRHREK